MRQKADIDQREPIDIRRREGKRPGLASTRRDFQATKSAIDDIAQETHKLRIASDRGVSTSDGGQYDRSQRPVFESPPSVAEGRGRQESEDLSPDRGFSPHERDVAHFHSTGTQEEVGNVQRRHQTYRRGSADLVVAQRDSRMERPVARYSHRSGLHEPRDVLIAADARRQAAHERPRDREDESRTRRASRLDTRRDSRYQDDQELEDSSSQRRYD